MKRLSIRQACFLVISLLVSLFVSFFTLLMPNTGLAQNAKPNLRIASTNSQITQLIYDLNLEDHLVGVDVTSQSFLKKHHKAIKILGYHRQLSAEGLLSLSPTHVIGSTHMGPHKVIELAKKSGIQILALPNAYTVGSLMQNLQTIGDALNAPVNTLVTTLENKKTMLETCQPTQSGIFLLSTDSQTVKIAGTQTSGHSFLNLIKTKNLSTSKHYMNTGEEALIKSNPDIIIMASPNNTSNTLLKKFSQARPETLVFDINANSLVSGLSLEAINQAVEICSSFVINKNKH